MAALNEESLLESPDLLAKSISDATSSPSKPLKQQNLRITPRKQPVNGTVKLQDFFLTTPPAAIARRGSPTRSIAQTENLLSPWKIRVTVQAEPQEEGMAGQRRGRRTSVSPSKATPSKRTRTSTVTTSVPLNDGDESEMLPSRRGRPRKSESSPAKRPGTPKPRKGRGQGSGGDREQESATILDSKSTPAKRPVGRPRKTPLRNVISAGEDDENGMDADSASIPPSPSPAKITIRRGRSASKVDIAEDLDMLSDDEIDLVGEEATAHRQSGDTGTRTLQSIIEGEPSEFAPPRRVLASISPQKGRPKSPSKGVLPRSRDPTLQHNEFDSIMESEGFSMVSLGSIPSARQHLSSVQQNRITAKSRRSPSSDEVPTSTQASGSRPTRSSSKQPSPGPDLNDSSQFLNLINQKTPSQPLSSPTLPPQVQNPPPTKSPMPQQKNASSTPKLVRVVRAGIALQGVTDPVKTSQSSKTPEESGAKGSRDRLDDMFAGFSAGTRRELRAGLRLGEELAKRQHIAAKASAKIRPSDDNDFDPFEEIAAAESSKAASERASSSMMTAPKTAQEVNYPVTYPPLPRPKQLPSPENSHAEEEDEDKMDWKADTPGNTLYRDPRLAQLSEAQRKAQRDAEREAEWAREREAVSKQVDEANKTDVVVITDEASGALEDSDVDSDDDEEVEQTLDIWQMEAKSSSHLQNASHPAAAPAPVPPQERLFPDGPLKPRRGKIPSPFRKQTATKIIYSDEPSDDEASLIPDYSSVKGTSPLTPAIRKPLPRQFHGDFSALSEFTRPVNTLPEAPEGFSSPVKARDKTITMSVEKRVRRGLLGDNYEEEIGSIERDMSVDDKSPPLKEEEISESIEREDEDIQPRVKNNTPVFPPIAQKRLSPVRNLPPENPSVKSSSAPTTNHSESAPTHPTKEPTTSTPAAVGSSVSWFSIVSQGVSNWFSPSTATSKPKPQKSSTARSKPKVSKNSIPAPARSKPRTQPKPPAHTQHASEATTAFISIHTPFNHIHYSHLRRIYINSLSSPISSNYLENSPHNYLLNCVMESHSWMKKLDERDIRAIDQFIQLLETQGKDLHSYRKGRAAPEKIESDLVTQKLFGVWVGLVQRGELGLEDGVEGEWDAKYLGGREEILKEQKVWKRKNEGSKGGRKRKNGEEHGGRRKKVKR